MLRFINITDFHAPELDVYARLRERQLQHYYEPNGGLFLAESPKVIARALDAGYEPVSVLAEERAAGEIPERGWLRRGAEVSPEPRGQIDVAEASPGLHGQIDAAEGSSEPCGQIEGAETRRLLERLAARGGELPVYTAPLSVLTQLTGFTLTRGMLCAMRRRALPSAAAVCAGARRIAVLEDVVNPTNVGAIFRSAAALQMDAVLLTRGCADPLTRRAIRVSMGTVFQVPWTVVEENGAASAWPVQGENVAANVWPVSSHGGSENAAGAPSPALWSLPQFLRRLGFSTAAMALRDDSLSIDDARLAAEERLAVLLGTEGEGLRPETIAACDYTVRIPMAHGVDSLNVAAASAVAFWELGKAQHITK